MKYYSQDGQDKFLNEVLFESKRKGYFLDIGAHDGITLSNTYFFEKNLNWEGICVEPNPKVFETLTKNRKSQNLNCCIYDRNSEVEFMVVTGAGEMLSGIIDTYNVKHIKRIDECIKTHGGSKSIVKIPARTISGILANSNKIDYCNIDVEGSELNILKTIDFEKYNIKIFTIENNYESSEVRKFLKKKGYSIIAVVGADEVFEKNSRRYYYIINMQFKFFNRYIKETIKKYINFFDFV